MSYVLLSVNLDRMVDWEARSEHFRCFNDPDYKLMCGSSKMVQEHFSLYKFYRQKVVVGILQQFFFPSIAPDNLLSRLVIQIIIERPLKQDSKTKMLTVFYVFQRLIGIDLGQV